MKAFALAILFVFSISCFAAPSYTNAPLRDLTIEDAVNIALTNHPHLAEALANVEASKAREQSAGKFPNPEAVVRMESAPTRAQTTSRAEYVAGISQPIPLGNKRAAARAVEEAQTAVRAKEYESAALELTRNVRNAFATALFTAEVLHAQTNLVATVQEMIRITKARVDAGDLPPADLARVQAEEAEQRLSASEAAAAHREATMALAAAMGDFRTVIASLDGRLEEILNLSELKAAAGILESHPAIVGMENAVAAQQARVRLANAERIPDLNLDLLYRRLQETREDAFDVGVSVAIPIFDSGRRRVQEAASELRAAEARLEKARNELGRELHSRELALNRAIHTASLLKEDVLPKIETSLRATQARYAAGDVALSELLLVRREASAAQIRYLYALRDVMESWAALKLH